MLYHKAPITNADDNLCYISVNIQENKAQYFTLCTLGLFQKKIPRGGGGGGGGGGKEGKQYIFLWVVVADIFQIIWVIGV